MPVSAGDKTTAYWANNRPAVQRGSISITPSAANTPTSAAITFPYAFSSTPTVQVTPNTSVPGTTVTGWSVTSISTTGCTLWVTRTNTSATTLLWTATGDD